MEQVVQQRGIGLSERFFELCKPIVGGYRTVIRPVEHARFPFPAVYAAPYPHSLYPFATAQKGRGEISVMPFEREDGRDPAGRP